MFDIFDLFISSQPRILRFLCTCLYPSSHSHILMLVYTCLYPRILTSSYLQVNMPLVASLHPHILRFMCACLYTCILTSLYPQFICAFWFSHILTSSYLQVYVCLLVCSHPQVNLFSMRINNCILASSSSLVLGNGARQFVNNLQSLQTEQAFVLDFYGTNRKIYWKQPLRAYLIKSCC